MPWIGIRVKSKYFIAGVPRPCASQTAALQQEWALTLWCMGALESPGVRTREHSGGWSSRQELFGNQRHI